MKWYYILITREAIHLIKRAQRIAGVNSGIEWIEWNAYTSIL